MIKVSFLVRGTRLVKPALTGRWKLTRNVSSTPWRMSVEVRAGHSAGTYLMWIDEDAVELVEEHINEYTR